MKFEIQKIYSLLKLKLLIHMILIWMNLYILIIINKLKRHDLIKLLLCKQIYIIVDVI
jgi:hypothetical protein